MLYGEIFTLYYCGGNNRLWADPTLFKVTCFSRCVPTQVPLLKCDQYTMNQYQQHTIAPCCPPATKPNHSVADALSTPGEAINLTAVTGTDVAVVLGARTHGDHYRHRQPSQSWSQQCVTRSYCLSEGPGAFGW